MDIEHWEAADADAADQDAPADRDESHMDTAGLRGRDAAPLDGGAEADLWEQAVEVPDADDERREA